MKRNEGIRWKVFLSVKYWPMKKAEICKTLNHLYIFGGCIKENYWRGREENISVYDILNKQYSYPNCQNYKNQELVKILV